MTITSSPSAAAALVDRTRDWLRTDQAAIMRQLPEQQTAAQWWTNRRGAHADSVITVPAWIEHYYGVQVTADPSHPTLGATAAAVADLLYDLSRQLDQAPLYLVDDLSVRTALITLAQSNSYRAASDSWSSRHGHGTVLFAEPVRIRQHTAPDINVPGITSEVARDSEPELVGVTWQTRGQMVRCSDWVHAGMDSIGIANLDEQIAKSTSKSGFLPPMLNNGHWKHTVTHETTQRQARQRLTEATNAVRSHPVPRWDGETVVVDDDSLLAPRVAAVVADALCAGLFTSTELPGAERGRSVHVLRPAAAR